MIIDIYVLILAKSKCLLLLLTAAVMIVSYKEAVFEGFFARRKNFVPEVAGVFFFLTS